MVNTAGLGSIIIGPFSAVYVFLLYQDLKASKGELDYTPTTGQKLKWALIALLGYIAVAAFLVLVVGAAVVGFISQFMGQLPI